MRKDLFLRKGIVLGLMLSTLGFVNNPKVLAANLPEGGYVGGVQVTGTTYDVINPVNITITTANQSDGKLNSLLSFADYSDMTVGGDGILSGTMTVESGATYGYSLSGIRAFATNSSKTVPAAGTSLVIDKDIDINVANNGRVAISPMKYLSGINNYGKNANSTFTANKNTKISVTNASQNIAVNGVSATVEGLVNTTLPTDVLTHFKGDLDIDVNTSANTAGAGIDLSIGANMFWHGDTTNKGYFDGTVTIDYVGKYGGSAIQLINGNTSKAVNGNTSTVEAVFGNSVTAKVQGDENDLNNARAYGLYITNSSSDKGIASTKASFAGPVDFTVKSGAYAYGIWGKNDGGNLEVTFDDTFKEYVEANKRGLTGVYLQGTNQHVKNISKIDFNKGIDLTIKRTGETNYLEGIYVSTPQPQYDTASAVVNVAGGPVTIMMRDSNDEHFAEDVNALRVDGSNAAININQDDSSIVKIEGNLYAKANTDIGLGSIKVNAVKGGSYIEGDMRADGMAEIDVKLAGANTYLESAGGLYFNTGGTTLGTINVDMSDGTLWKVRENADYKGSMISNLNATNATVDMTHVEGYQNFYIYDSLRGNNTTFVLDTDLQGSGDAKDVGVKNSLSDKIYILGNSSAGNFNIDVHDHSSKFADEGYLLLVVDGTANPAATFTGTANVQNGGLFAHPGIITDVDPTGYNNVPTGSKNWYLTLDKSKPYPITDNGRINAGFAENRYGWIFNEQDTLLKRLGELRDFPKNNQGLWVRYKHGDYSANNGYAADSKYNTFQIGWDKKTKENDNLKQFTGLAYHHTWGKDSYNDIAARGNSSADILSVYNSTVYNKGHYLDLVGKVGKMRGDFDLSGDYAETGDTNSWMYSLSAEYGRKKMMGSNGWYIEPQTQLTWTHLGSSGYTSSQDTNGYLSAINSTIFRVGTTIGRHTGALLPENHESFASEPYKGQTNIYAKVFWNHEFSGDAFYSFLDKNREVLDSSHDYSGSWWTVGVGFTHNLNEKTHLYFDVEKNFGGEMNKNWAIQAGLRWAFGGPKKVAPLVVEPTPEPAPEPVKETYLDSVHFDFDVDTPIAGEMYKIDHFAEVAKENPDKKYAVVGNTDAIGTDEYNMDLSKRRADNVKAEAAKRGVPATQMQENYLGKAHPVEDNSTDKGRAANRRVEIYEHETVK